MMLLKIKTADGKEQTVSLEGKCPMTIGRSDGAGLCVADRKVSRRHAEITANDGNLFIEDLASRTGTRVNGKPIS